MGAGRLKKYLNDSLSFSIKEVKDMFGYERGRVESWVRGSFISYNTVPYGEKRTQIVFTYEQLYSLALFRLLVDSGFDRKRAGVYNRHMVKKWEEIRSIGYEYMVIDFESEYLEDSNGNYPLLEETKSEKVMIEDQKWFDENQPEYVVSGDKVRDITETKFPEPDLFGSAKEFGNIFSVYDLVTVINIRNIIADVDKKVSDFG